MESFDPARPDFSPYGFRCVRWQPTRMPRSDRHNEVEINLLERGSVTYWMGGRKLALPARRLAVFWAGVPHQVVGFEDLTTYFVLTLPLVWFLQWGLAERFVQEILRGEAVLEPDLDRGDEDLRQFAAWSDDLESGDEALWRITQLELQARLHRLALRVAAEPRPAPGPRIEGADLSKAEAIACFIATHYTAPLNAATISRAVGLHPNYAMALFRRTFGTTLSRHVTQHRLSHAQRLLLTTADPIVDIAYQAGFGSLSRFNEAFRQAFGCTPRDYRSGGTSLR